MMPVTERYAARENILERRMYFNPCPGKAEAECQSNFENL
jgi:hypothetical protein